MRTMLLGGVFACLLLATTAAADPGPCNDRAAKLPRHATGQPLNERQGGDTIDSALRIDSLPFADAGTTCGYANDYDEVCPYNDSVAPDVVYSFTPSTETLLTIDMAGSAYDTKIYVYDDQLELVACNDDYYPDYTSLLEYVRLYGARNYFIVIDGYGEECGEYSLAMNVTEECTLICPAGAMLENEPPLEDGYEDNHNGGCCGSDFGNPFQTIPGRSNGTQVLCGMSGWYLYEGIQVRDTDWFTVTMGESGVLEMRGDAEFPLYMFHLGPTDCSSVGVLQNVIVGPCSENSLTITAEPGEEVWLWTGPTTFEGPGSGAMEFDYVLWLDGLAPGGDITGVPGGWPTVEANSLSTVKGLFD